MSDTLDILLNHRTYRDFDADYQLPQEDLQTILTAARQSANWMNGQAYSILVIQDKKIREQLVEWNPGNPHMLNSSVFLLFVGDLHRAKMISEHYHTASTVGESLDHVLVATTDAAMALQSAIVATEALGLGCVPVGSVRKNIEELAELLHLPEQMFPLCGLSIGKPSVAMKVKPRLPEEAVVFYDSFKDYDYPVLAEYDQMMEKFAEARETKLWTVKFKDYYEAAANQKVDEYFKKHHLLND